MTTKQKIIEAATRREYGGFVNTDGKWCMIRNPEEFKAFLEDEFGFEVVECKEAPGSTAIAVTADGYVIAWNGYCGKNR